MQEDFYFPQHLGSLSVERDLSCSSATRERVKVQSGRVAPTLVQPRHLLWCNAKTDGWCVHPYEPRIDALSAAMLCFPPLFMLRSSLALDTRHTTLERQLDLTWRKQADKALSHLGKKKHYSAKRNPLDFLDTGWTLPGQPPPVCDLQCAQHDTLTGQHYSVPSPDLLGTNTAGGKFIHLSPPGPLPERHPVRLLGSQCGLTTEPRRCWITTGLWTRNASRYCYALYSRAY